MLILFKNIYTKRGLNKVQLISNLGLGPEIKILEANVIVTDNFLMLDKAD